MFNEKMWSDRGWGWALEFLEISRTHAGFFRLWDSSEIETIGIYSSLSYAKKKGASLLNDALFLGSETCEKILFKNWDKKAA